MTTTIGSLDLNAFSDLHSDLTQYFWFEPNASATYGAGAHVTLVPDTSFISNPTGQNILMNTDGFSIRNGLLPMMTLDNDSLDFNVVDTTAGTYTTTATFTATGAQIGQSGAAHSVIDANGQRFYATDGTTQLANIGYGEGVNATGGVSVAPYYTFGIRASNAPSTIGIYSVAEGYNTTASVGYAHAEGSNTIASNSSAHAEGSGTTASGLFSHAEGGSTRATGDYSHAEGAGSRAIGKYSHAEGVSTKATGTHSHAEGLGSSSEGNYSHAQNYGTVAARKSQTVIGENNIADTGGTDETTRGDYAFIVGNGNGVPDDPMERSNALTVDWKGNVVASGSIVTDSNFNQGYSVIVSSLAGSTYLGTAIDLGEVGLKHPIFNGFDISGTGTARIHTLGHYLYKENGHWKAYIKMRNDNTSAINDFTVTAYITWI